MATQPNTPVANEAGNNFVAVLTQLRRGAAVADASEGLADVVKAVRKTGKKGKLTITICVVPLNKGDAVDLVDEIALKMPKPNNGSSLFFADDAGQLLRNDPRQGELRLGVLEGGAATPNAPAAQAK